MYYKCKMIQRINVYAVMNSFFWVIFFINFNTKECTHMHRCKCRSGAGPKFLESHLLAYNVRPLVEYKIHTYIYAKYSSANAESSNEFKFLSGYV